MPMEHDAALNTIIEFGKRLVAANKVTQHGAKPQAVIIAGKQKMGQEIHNVSLPESVLSGLPVPLCGIMQASRQAAYQALGHDRSPDSRATRAVSNRTLRILLTRSGWRR